MKITELTAVALRIFAIYLFIYALSQSTSLFNLIGTQSTEGNATISLPFYIFWVGTPLIISAVIWFFPNTSTKLFLPKYKADEVAPVTKSELYIAGIIFMGIFLLTKAIPDTLYWITRLYMQSRMEAVGVSFELTPSNKASLLSTFTELVIGVWLLFGSKGLLKFIRKARSWPSS